MPPKGMLQGSFPSLPLSGSWAEDERQKTAKVLEGEFSGCSFPVFRKGL